MTTVWTMLGAYLVGAVPFSFIVGWIRGVDVRRVGSRNVGATNVARAAGPAAGLSALLLDASKGVAAVLLGAQLGGPRLAAGAGCAAVLGHVLSPFLGFRGGKGVATAAGVFVTLSPLAMLGVLFVFGLVLAAGRVVSVASLAAATVLPVFVYVLDPHKPTLWLAVITSLVVWVGHTGNLRRLIGGKEPPLGASNSGGRTPEAGAS